MKRFARERMRGGMVAENSAVCLSGGVSARIFSTSSMKPMLSISSASSSTSDADVFDIEGLPFDQVEQTTGGADHNIHAAVEARDLRSIGLPAINGQDTHIKMLPILGHRIGDL